MTTSETLSRRYLLAAAAGSLAAGCGGAAQAPAVAAAPAAQREDTVVRAWYAAWQKRDWGALEALATEDFTFSSAAGDDRISKSTFKTQCWDTQSGLIERFELQSVLDNENEAFVKYVCWTKKGKVFRNVEHFTFKGGKIATLYCYFGEQAGYPAAADKAKG